MNMEWYDGVLNSPALPLAVAAWHEMLEKGWVDRGALLIAPEHQAIVACATRRPVGVLTWLDEPHASRLSVIVGYVLPTFRRQGVHRAMFAALAARAVRLRRLTIVSSTALTNEPARQMMQREQRMEMGVFTVFQVPLD